MAAGIPKEKSVELLTTYGEMLKLGIAINDFDYMRGVRELEKIRTPASISALGVLHAVAGRFSKAEQLFESAVNEINDPHSVAINYCVVLEVTGNMAKLRDKIYEFAERFETKTFTKMAYSIAYRTGDRDALEMFMDKHIKLLSEDEGRTMAEKHKLELLGEVDDAYNTSGCTKEQFFLLASITQNVCKEFSVKTGRVEVSKNNNMSYVIDLHDIDPKIIAQMNYVLAERICMEEALDNCSLTARFSPFRELHTGVSYGG
ncbi:hypothetical protein BVG97_06950 [Serratia marcescens]|uniref:hypothetical protein n=1 Tax=Serratia TaxID=613 RepID=UPI000B5F51D6|nr:MULTISPECIES: hypothetical protein [Serratia]ASL90841.1 hypothetical protein BVG97_06950 [Serratia marcescens]MDI6977586.1 hypothetical protein [Serratia sp. Se-RSBMAAmG]MDI9262464.1 hypothetical protein [Serratia sp. PF2-63]MDI9271317.1 hypothetical protein [Serratia sp. PF-27]BEM81950.1 hypothetical protein SME41J_12740 [Serratia marcescens]